MNVGCLNNERLSNFELLRILAMFLIVLHHCIIHGVFPYWFDNSSALAHINNSMCFILSSVGKIGVTLFVLLSGYFFYDFRLKKWFDIYIKTLFFSVSILVICSFIFPVKLPLASVKASLFPFIYNSYWFITTYLILYAFSPLLNKILNNSSERIMRIYLILGAVFWVILPYFGFNGTGYSNLVWFMYLYLLGASIKLGYLTFLRKYLGFLSCGIFGYTVVLSTTTFFLAGEHIRLNRFFSYVDLNSPYTLIISLWIFYLFKDLKMRNPAVNRCASSMFGVYLLHDNNLIRPCLWHVLLGMDTKMDSHFFIVWAFTASVGVFVFCILLDKILSLIYVPLINYIERQLSRIKIWRKIF
ncbi:MAG: acyltransferase family protein [Alphaproteobacteria bacterium]|nr:acyltransferase family protein [Alphaproteobacteria bacterium]